MQPRKRRGGPGDRSSWIWPAFASQASRLRASQHPSPALVAEQGGLGWPLGLLTPCTQTQRSGVSQGNRDVRKNAPHCVPHSAKGGEGQPVPEKVPWPPQPAHCYRREGGASGHRRTLCHDRAALALSWLGRLSVARPLPLQTLRSSLPCPAPLLGPPAGQPWPRREPPAWPSTLSGKTVPFCLSSPQLCSLEFLPQTIFKQR